MRFLGTRFDRIVVTANIHNMDVRIDKIVYVRNEPKIVLFHFPPGSEDVRPIISILLVVNSYIKND